MVSRAGRPKPHDSAAAAAPRRSTRSRKAAAPDGRDTAPDVYGDMVAEAVAADPVDTESRPLKRRKVSKGPITPDRIAHSEPASASVKSLATVSSPIQGRAGFYESDITPAKRQQQTVEYSSSSEESDFGFEDVDLGPKDTSSPAPAQEDEYEDIVDVAASVAPPDSAQKARVHRRKPATASEKAFRLRVHKVHFLTLLGHCMYANSRCNSAAVQRLTGKLVDKRMKSYLNPKINDTQFQRNRSFMDGLEQAKTAFKAEFRITSSGMARPRWASDGDNGDGPSSSADGEPMDLADFVSAARDLEGSQDTGNQLFCAMLRAAGVEARLVCSLQTLPFANPPPKSSTPQKQKKPAVFAIAPDTDPNLSDASASDGNMESSDTIGKVPSIRRRLGQPGFCPSVRSAPPPKEKKKPIRTLSYPVYWVEAFNAAHQKWIPVDPMVTNTVGKPSKIEPPASYDLNMLIYAIAFESDGVARDVTRRYAKAFNAKTRRQRIESSGEEGAKWLKKALRLFRRRRRLDRDQVEDAELAQKEAREGLPSNVLDFKDHPYYALERHLRRHEVLHPRREAGKVNAGTAAKPRMEPVFRRQDVLSCKSADKWYRLGREVKRGEQPLKHVPARASRRRDLGDEDEEADASTTALYSIHQTQSYVPPPVRKGKVPKNAFGNLDVYVPSMVPAGGVHIRHALTQQAARTLNLDFADAVTGFKFQGRKGTAIIEGAVVAQEYGEAVEAVIEGLEYEALLDASKARSLAALRLWARFLKGLRIAERVAAYGEKSTTEAVGDDEIGQDGSASGDADDATNALDPTMPTAGQYSIVELTMPSKPARKSKKKAFESEVEDDDDDFAPSARRSGRKKGIAVVDDDDDDDEAEYMPDYEGGGGGFFPDQAEETIETGGGFVSEDGGGGGFLPDDSAGQEGGFIPTNTDAEESGGGFLPENTVDDMGGGGFVAENDEGGPAQDDLFGDGDSGGGFIVDVDQDKSAEDDLSGDDGTGGGFAAGDSMPIEYNDDGLDGTDEAKMNERTSQDANARAAPVTDEGITANNEIVKRITPAGDAAETDPGVAHSARQKPALPDLGPLTDKDPMDRDDEDEEDRGSLLSHDPEDDDAEPDWLESD